jgi:rRNA maturation protein Nop10
MQKRHENRGCGRYISLGDAESSEICQVCNVYHFSVTKLKRCSGSARNRVHPAHFTPAARHKGAANHRCRLLGD